MFVRCAFFEGKIKPGQEKAFHDFVAEQLVPLWTAFPGAAEVRVLSQMESDTANPAYPLVLAFKFPDRAAIERALASDVRQQSREVTGELVKLFEGRIFHTIFDLRHDVAL
jgi:hypothetical protein